MQARYPRNHPPDGNNQALSFKNFTSWFNDCFKPWSEIKPLLRTSIINFVKQGSLCLNGSSSIRFETTSEFFQLWLKLRVTKPDSHAMVAFLYKPEVQAKEESQRAADVNPLVLAPRLRCLLLFYCLQAHPLCWLGPLFTLASIKKKQPMERSPWALKISRNLN